MDRAENLRAGNTDRHQVELSLLTPTGQTLGAQRQKLSCISTVLTVKINSSIYSF